MPLIEKRYDKKGRLEWAKGTARDIHLDKGVLRVRGCVQFRLSGETSRCFHALVPRHLASLEIEGRPNSMTPGGFYSDVPPFRKWRFVLITYEGPIKHYVCLAQEISGDRLIEVAISRTGQPATKSECES